MIERANRRTRRPLLDSVVLWPFSNSRRRGRGPWRLAVAGWARLARLPLSCTAHADADAAQQRAPPQPGGLRWAFEPRHARALGPGNRRSDARPRPCTLVSVKYVRNYVMWIKNWSGRVSRSASRDHRDADTDRNRKRGVRIAGRLGRTRIGYTGTVLFSDAAAGIDIDTRSPISRPCNPAIGLTGLGPRSIYTYAHLESTSRAPLRVDSSWLALAYV